MNLLPETYQKVIRREIILRLLFVFIVLISIVIVIAIVFMLPSYFALRFSTADVFRRLDTENKTFERQNIGSFEDTVRKINERIGFYVANEHRRYALAPLLVQIANMTDTNIILNSIDLRSENKGLFIFDLKGIASTRDAFLSYVQKLKGAPEFSEVRSPISNLLRESKVPFEIEVLIKKESYFYVANK